MAPAPWPSSHVDFSIGIVFFSGKGNPTKCLRASVQLWAWRAQIWVLLPAVDAPKDPRRLALWRCYCKETVGAAPPLIRCVWRAACADPATQDQLWSPKPTLRTVPSRAALRQRPLPERKLEPCCVWHRSGMAVGAEGLALERRQVV